MKFKKTKLLYLSLGIMVVGLVIIFLGANFFMNSPKEIVPEKENDKKVYSTGISMMLETSAGSGEYQETTDTTWAQAIEKGYIFNETMSKCENGSILTWDETNKIVKFTGNVSDRCYVYFDVKALEKLVDHVINLYTSDEVNGLYKHDGIGTYGEYEAGDNSYRFTGSNPNNYVCFGSTAAICPTDNLYRIIGIFDGQVKLIKYDYTTKAMTGSDGDYSTDRTLTSTYKGKLTSIPWYYWNSSGSNTWSTSKLYTVNLNTNFKKYLQMSDGKDWTTYIDGTKTWKAGGNTWANIGTQTNAKTVYQNEIINPADDATVTAMFGLMYVSEYRYAADPTREDAWSAVNANSYNNTIVTANNWMSMGGYDWTISRSSDNTGNAFSVTNVGNVYTYNINNSNRVYGVRPTFFLKPEVELKSGSGTQSDPYRLN